jgi:hypothetical protein
MLSSANKERTSDMWGVVIKNRVQLTKLALVVLSIALLAGCAATGGQRARSLEETLRAYEKAIRWSEFGTAMQFLHPEHLPTAREAEMAMKRFEQIKINGYVVRSQSPATDENTFLQTAQISFENRHNSRVRSVNDPQVWRWEQEPQRWMLISGLPDITRR